MNIQGWIIQILLLAGPILAAVTIHELAHGWIAYRLGDPTAKMAGRLTLNPIKHLDPLGTLAFIVTQRIGWAKPVPIDARYFKNPRQGMIWVSLAGPAANIILAFICARLMIMIHTGVMTAWGDIGLDILRRAIVINVGLAVFNLLPIHPLDGSHVLEGLLPPQAARTYASLAPYGVFILLGLIFFNLVGRIIWPVMDAVISVMFF